MPTDSTEGEQNGAPKEPTFGVNASISRGRQNHRHFSEKDCSSLCEVGAACASTRSSDHGSLKLLMFMTQLVLEAKGGAKASAPEWESGGQRGRKKHGALFGGRGEESFICGSLPGSSCERRERRETERRETERRERERGERDERDEKEMREMREMRETVRQ